MKKITIFLISIFLSITLIAQKEYVEKNKTYSLARVYLKNNKIFKVNNLQLENDSTLTFKIIGTQAKSQHVVADVKYVSVKSGSHALEYGLIGAGSGLLGSLLGVAQVEADPMTSGTDVNNAPIVIGITAGFGVIGAFIGAFSYKWKRLYLHSNEDKLSFIVYPQLKNNIYGIGIFINL